MNWYDWLNPGQHAWGDYAVDLNRRALQRYPDSRWAQAYRSTSLFAPERASVDKSTANRYLYQARGTPFLGDLLRAGDEQRHMEDYLKFYGLDWSDMKYPSLIGGTGVFGATSRPFVSALLTRGFYR